MFPDDEQVARVDAAFFDPFEYLMLRHKAGLITTDFARSLGRWPTTSPATNGCRTSA